MFFAEDRRPIVQAMILAESEDERRRYLDQLLPFQRNDFEGIFKALGHRPATIRLIDPPLHEFLPNQEELIAEVATLKATHPGSPDLIEKEKLLAKVSAMHEVNPMMGLRGCRLSIVFPEICEMQTRAIIEGAIAAKKAGAEPHPEIMIPLVGHVNELRSVRVNLERVAKQVTETTGETIDYMFGTMIEIPRAAVTSDEIAAEAQFFSFGTNDLTQMTFGFSRDDSDKFLKPYIEQKILPGDPFESIDQNGVGKLMEMSVALAKKVRPDIKLGICGEHGGEPASVAFCHKIGLNYVSCSPYRVPIARLAAAQANLKDSGSGRDR
jgi:pyruvate,orthophosphate dikinase